jgi:pimeloyl-ACP methyl ester carboxylesterase
MGLSMGGHNAIAYAAGHPERVSHLIAIDIPPALDMSKGPNWQASLHLAAHGHGGFRTFEEAVEAARAGNPTAPEENLRYRTQCNLRELDDGRLMLKWDSKVQARWQPADLWDKLAQVRVPVLLVRGGLTTVLPSATAQRMVAAFPDAELVEVPDSGHSVPTDRPEKLAPIVLDWLAQRGY